MSLIVQRVPITTAIEAVRNAFGTASWPHACTQWGEVWARSCPDILTIEALLCDRDGHVAGFALLYRVPRLELLRYLGRQPQRLNGWLRARWRDPLTLCVTYVDLPFADEEAVFVAPGDPAPQEVRQALIRAALADRHAQAVCVRASAGTDLERDLSAFDLIPIDVPPATALDLRAGYDGWLATRSSSRRTRIRHDERVFTEAGGRMLHLTDPRPYARRLAELADNTVRSNVARGGIEAPSRVTAAFFEAMAEIPAGLGVVLAAEVNERIVGYLVLLAGPGARAIVGPCGLDYDEAPASRAYFALWPHAVAWASRHGCQTMAFGSEAYTNKERLGAVKVTTNFHAAFCRQPLKMVAGPLSRSLSAFLGRVDD